MAEKILEIDPSRTDYFPQLANLHKQLGNLDEAESYLKRNVEAFPTRIDGYDDLSDFYSDVGRLTEAREALDHALLLEPDSLDLTMSLIDLDIKSGAFVESHLALLKSLDEVDTTRGRIRILARLLNLAALSGKTSLVASRADELYEASAEVSSPVQVGIIHTLRLPIVSSTGRPEQALERVAEIRTTILPPYDDLVGVGEAWIYADLGRTSEARATLAAAEAIVETMKFETYRGSIALIEGMIDEADGDLPNAITHYREALDKSMRASETYHLRLARALRLSGETAEALDIMVKEVKTNPAYPGFQLELAHLRHRQGDLAAAREHLQAAQHAWTDAEPEFLPAQEARQLEGLLQAR